MSTVLQQEIIGIIGGLGPHAHIDLEHKLLEARRHLLGASSDDDYPEWILSSIPSMPKPSLSWTGQAEDPVPWLLRHLRRLQAALDADEPERRRRGFAIMACNTAHVYLDDLRRAGAPLDLLDMPRETARVVRRTYGPSRTGIMATTATLQAGVFHRALEEVGCQPVTLLDGHDGQTLQRQLVMEPILGRFDGKRHSGDGIKLCGATPEWRDRLREGLRRLIRSTGAQVVILGCTEIPLAVTEHVFEETPLVDSSRALAEAAIRRAYGLPRPEGP